MMAVAADDEIDARDGRGQLDIAPQPEMRHDHHDVGSGTELRDPMLRRRDRIVDRDFLGVAAVEGMAGGVDRRRGEAQDREPDAPYRAHQGRERGITERAGGDVGHDHRRANSPQVAAILRHLGLGVPRRHRVVAKRGEPGDREVGGGVAQGGIAGVE